MNLVDFVSDGVGSRSIGLRASAVSMSSGVKWVLDAEKFYVERSGFR